MISAPSWATSWMLALWIPPSTSMWVEAELVDAGAQLADLRAHRGDEALAAEAGVDAHHEDEVAELQHVIERSPRSGCAG
jgi:hypothetical protein